jgi:hypothetical protein
MNQRSRSTRQLMITASEVGEFVFCAKAWQLKRDGAVADSPHLASGVAFHSWHGSRLALDSRLHRLGVALIGAACLLLVGLLAWYFVGVL